MIAIQWIMSLRIKDRTIKCTKLTRNIVKNLYERRMRKSRPKKSLYQYSLNFISYKNVHNQMIVNFQKMFAP